MMLQGGMPIMITKKTLDKIIGTNNDCLKVNKKMIQIVGVECAILYTYLLSTYMEKYNDCINDENYFLCNVDEIEENLKFSPFKQRNLLNELIKYKLIKIKYGQSRTRYISINEDLSVLEELLFDIKYTKVANKLITYIVKNIEDLSAEENFDYEDSIQLYNYLSKINFNKSIKESKEYKNLGLGWLSLSENDKNFNGKETFARELAKR